MVNIPSRGNILQKVECIVWDEGISAVPFRSDSTRQYHVFRKAIELANAFNCTLQVRTREGSNLGMEWEVDMGCPKQMIWEGSLSRVPPRWGNRESMTHILYLNTSCDASAQEGQDPNSSAWQQHKVLKQLEDICINQTLSYGMATHIVLSVIPENRSATSEPLQWDDDFEDKLQEVVDSQNCYEEITITLELRKPQVDSIEE